MSEDSPFFLFDPDSRGSLYFKLGKGHPIVNADIDRVLDNDAEASNDPRMLPILIASHKGLIKNKRGRPIHKDSFKYKGRILWLTDEVEARAAEIREERQGMTAIEKRALLTPKEQAAEDVARKYKMGAGLTLINAISSLKSDRVFGD